MCELLWDEPVVLSDRPCDTPEAHTGERCALRSCPWPRGPRGNVQKGGAGCQVGPQEAEQWEPGQGHGAGRPGQNVERDRCHRGQQRQQGDLSQAETLAARPGGWGPGWLIGDVRSRGTAGVPAVCGHRKSVWDGTGAPAGSGEVTEPSASSSGAGRSWAPGLWSGPRPLWASRFRCGTLGASGRAEEETGRGGHWGAV